MWFLLLGIVFVLGLLITSFFVETTSAPLRAIRNTIVILIVVFVLIIFKIASISMGI